MADLDIGKLPFQDELTDNDIIHMQTAGDKKSTLARVWSWVQGKITQTNIVTRGILVQDNDQNWQLINVNDFQKSTMTGQLNAMQPLSNASLIAEGYTELEIKMYRIARKNPYFDEGDYRDTDMSQAIYQAFLDSQPAKDYLLSMGWAFCDGGNGTRDLRGCVRRMIDAGAGRDPGRQVGTYQEDTLQDHPHDVNIPVAQDWTSRVGRYDSMLNWGSRVVQSGNVKNARTSFETRPKNVSAISFQKIADLDWRLIPAKPPKFN